METTVIVKNGQLPESVQDILRHKASKLPRFFDRTTLIQVIVDMRHAQPNVEIIVSAEEVNDFFATDSGTNVVTAFDGALNKIEIQLKKHKEKRKGHRSSEPKIDLSSE
ncbi:MAG: ribosome-associated translation inhibitor RaiA [Planctomycetota bacterium]|nr:ribosome-associated translation inhibitor RaiA [Planctomycetota bacterium]